LTWVEEVVRKYASESGGSTDISDTLKSGMSLDPLIVNRGSLEDTLNSLELRDEETVILEMDLSHLWTFGEISVDISKI
jgi:hypothetical protein